MNIFDEYAEFYDQFYKDKDYLSECNYVTRLLARINNRTRSILDLGCGTGRHALHFAEMGYQVTGIDYSEKMLSLARCNIGKHKQLDKPPVFKQGDIRNIDGRDQYDAIVALFHVISYLASDSDVQAVFNTARAHMHKDSAFVFDFWYAPAVEHLKPEPRTKIFSRNGYSISRNCTPHWKRDREIVEVDFEIKVDGNSEKRKFKERHVMRYFDDRTLGNMLQKSGMEIVDCYAWLTEDAPGIEDWSACMVAKAV